MNLQQEKDIKKRGFNVIAGLDEAGRGPIAGPVTAAAVVITDSRFKRQDSRFKEIKDSKQMSAKQREDFYHLINECSGLEWATGRVGSTAIDKINILESSKLAMQRAVTNLNKKLNQKVSFLLIDGNFKIDSNCRQQSFISGDQRIFSIVAASVMAKVSRDRAMKRYHRKHPGYGFAQHKGYPTTFHKRMVKQKGPCKIHRRSFNPVAKYCVD